MLKRSIFLSVRTVSLIVLVCVALVLLLAPVVGSAPKTGEDSVVEVQPLVAQVKRLVETMDYLGEPFAPADKQALERAGEGTDAGHAVETIQNILDKRTLLYVDINPESRVSVTRGLAEATLVEKGWRSFLVKVRNNAGVTAQLRAASPNALPVYARGQHPEIPGGFSLDPVPTQTIKPSEVANRWLEIIMFDKQPLESRLSGLGVEYRIIQFYSRDRGRREAQIAFNVGQGTQDIGYRNELPVLFNALPSKDVTLRVRDEDGKPTTASFIIRDRQERLYPAKTKRLAPDFSFHPQIYREDGEKIRLPQGDYTVEVTRGPEYLTQRQSLKVIGDSKAQEWVFQLKRWIKPSAMGWYSGDHHIHAAGCSHYEAPTDGVLPNDMIRHILGEALNVGDILNWGAGYYFQKQFFEAKVNKLSTADELMRYDLEISGFPSSFNGHLVLLGLNDQDYPGTKKLEDWPTWDLPILKWAKSQDAIVGFAHSGWGLEVKTDKLPNYEMPAFDGIGANEYIVDVTQGAVDFISTVDTPPIWELNIWYHTLNSGFRTRISGETDFPCIYGERVGVGRSYVKIDGKLNYDSWIKGIRDGRAYVSDGKSHLFDFSVNDLPVGTQGSELKLDKAQTVRVTAKVSARLNATPDDTLRGKRYDQQPYWEIERARIKVSREVPVEVIVNGKPVASKNIFADGTIQSLSFDVPIEQSSWVALRILPSSHTNPIFVTVGNRPIRSSRLSAEWCLKAVDQCWSQKAPQISIRERPEAERVYEHAREIYRKIATECETE
jgi:hypothetical protein